MRAMILEAPKAPLQEVDWPQPKPGPGQVLLRVHACGVCRTDLHVFDGELTEPKFPLILGHEIVGTVVEQGVGARDFAIGDRVGVPWLGYACGRCRFCVSGRENLCDFARFTGYQIDGGYAEYTVADQRFCLALPLAYSDAEAAPLLCAGLIGYRSLLMAGEGKRLGIYGFGAAAHIIAQVARYQSRDIYAFTRRSDVEGQRFAREMGATWVGDSETQPPSKLDAAILYAPVGSLIPAALRTLDKGGIVVCAGIHMSAIPSFPYEILWEERMVRSVANLTRRDGREFLTLAPAVPVHTIVETFPLTQANEALNRLRQGRIRGAAVLVPTAG